MPLSYVWVPQGTIMGPMLWNTFVQPCNPGSLNRPMTQQYTTTSKNLKQSSQTLLHTKLLSFYQQTHCRSPLPMLLSGVKITAWYWTLVSRMRWNSHCRSNYQTNTHRWDWYPRIKANKTTQHNIRVRSTSKIQSSCRCHLGKNKAECHTSVKLKKADVDESSLATFYHCRIVPTLTLISDADKDKLKRYQRVCRRVISPASIRHLACLGIKEEISTNLTQ